MKIFTFLIAVAAFPFVLFSCKKDETKAVLNNAKPTLSVSNPAPLILVQGNAANSAITFTWDSVYFGFRDALVYTLQMAPATANFSADSTVTVTVSKNTKQKTFTVSELNIALAPIMAAGTTKNIQFRLASTMGNVVSNVVPLTITTFEDWPVPLSYTYLYTPGAYQGWSPDADVIAKMYTVNKDKKYAGAIYLPQTDGGFKFTPAPTWTDSWGMTGTPAITSTNNGTQTTAAGTMAYNGGSDFKFTGPAGYYIFSLDADAGTWTAKQSDYSIIGDAAINWDTDVPLEFDAATQTLFKVLPMKVGEWKFRMNGSWNGGDFPNPNLKISEAGTYKVQLDMRVPSAPYWKVTKQ